MSNDAIQRGNMESAPQSERLAVNSNLLRQLAEAIFVHTGLVVEQVPEVKRIFSALEEEKRQLERMNISDPLTGLLNRRGLEQAFEKMLALRARERQQNEQLGIAHNEAPMALLLMDIDHFKQVNDTYGHAAGDEVLKQAADIIRLQIRDSDIAARWGGEEVVILFDDIGDIDQFAVAMGEFQKRLKPTTEGGTEVTASMGLVFCTPASTNSDCLTKMVTRADDLMYEAKKSGRNTLVIADELLTA